MDEGLVPIADLFGNYRTLKPGGKALDERAELIKFFYEQGFTHKNGTRFTKAQLGIRCAHLKPDHLYRIKSEYLDKKHRGENAGYYFMGATKTKTV